MKYIPTDELIILLKAHFPRCISVDSIHRLFDIYGDDYHKDSGSSPFELTNENQKRKNVIESLKKLSSGDV